MRVIRLPRNYRFIQRLPRTFPLQVIQEKNRRPDGTWYEVDILGHRLNILSREPLKPFHQYLIQKRSSLLLAIVMEIKHENLEGGQENIVPIEISAETFDRLGPEDGESFYRLFLKMQEQIKGRELKVYLCNNGILAILEKPDDEKGGHKSSGESGKQDEEASLLFLYFHRSKPGLWDLFLHSPSQDKFLKNRESASFLGVQLDSLLKHFQPKGNLRWTTSTHISSMIRGLNRYS